MLIRPGGAGIPDQYRFFLFGCPDTVRKDAVRRKIPSPYDIACPGCRYGNPGFLKEGLTVAVGYQF